MSASLRIEGLAGHWNRLGIAAHFVARFEPFAGFRSADLINTLNAQIGREHCLFAIDGPRVVGYLGWALYDADVAAPFARGGRPPPNALAHGGDVAWILTAVAAQHSALLPMVRALRTRYPGLRVMGIRHKPDARRVVFDRAPRRAGAVAGADIRG